MISGGLPTASAMRRDFDRPELAHGTAATDWITNGGTTFNQRYSPLDELTPPNVSALKSVWRIHLGSATGTKYSGEARKRPLVLRSPVCSAPKLTSPRSTTSASEIHSCRRWPRASAD
jgi:glucose dehydrogenase